MDNSVSKKEKIAEKLAKLKQINEERPCSECIWHNAKSTYYTCDAATGSCNFEHSRFTRIGEGTRKVRPKSMEGNNKQLENSAQP